MSSSQQHDFPELALSDIMHVMSPPPHDDDTPHDFQALRKRALEISAADQPTTINKELLDMVMRLTSAVPPDPDQLIRQAELISGLAEQRDFLMRQAEEQRLRWDAEKDGWARMAEALIAQQTRNRGSADREEELDRQNSIFEADNKNLRSKLSETQSRLTSLEAELTRLRPLLLMQPLNLPTPPKHPPRKKGKEKEKEAPPFTDEDHDAYMSPYDDEDTTPHTTPKHRHSRHIATNPKKKPPPAAQKSASRPISSDARAEHLLLAARKIGKHRAGLLAGLVQSQSQLQYQFQSQSQHKDKGKDKSREQERDETLTATPNTPRRSYAYLNTISPVRNPLPGAPIPAPVLLPPYSTHLLQTPSSSSSTTVPPSSSRRHPHSPRPHLQSPRPQKNPPTPMDSLLNAARMMNDEEDRESTASPLPKRRKLATSSLKPAVPSLSSLREHDNDAASGRVRSALDVLADQAAAFSSQEQPQQEQSTSQDKGKGKSRGKPSEEKEKGKPRARAKRKAVGAAPEPSAIPARTQFRSQTPTVPIRSDSRTPTVPVRSSSHTPPESIQPSSRPQPAEDWDSGIEPTNLRPVHWGDGGADPTPQRAVDAEMDTSVDVDGPSKNADVDEPSSIDADGSSDSLPPSAEQGMVVDTTTNPEGPQPVRGTDQHPFSPGFANVLDPDLLPHPQPQGTDSNLNPTSAPIPHSSHQTPGPQMTSIPPIPPPSSSSISHPIPIPPPSSITFQPQPEIHRRAASIPAPSSSNNRGLGNDAHEPSPSPLHIRFRHETDPGANGTGAATAGKRQRSPYVKWSKEEDELLSQAVAKYGQKWDLVQKALPARGYHQVRQRWLRKLGVFDSKPDLSSFQTAPSALSRDSEPPPNPKLGLAPLSSELAFTARGTAWREGAGAAS
ncbi:hypothetical protein BV22DRAFT_1036102 [Leucogyrophana mollusca]|uniref:Uncharacterized protein n=1 Tax=Leucogyrophana mollusca TaxID=85980 RepID=A0ACB8BDV3_9AGAM|nr:hypothetical protein BV22DRAFT_1036102 [Leucogyrophana mollusca]